MSRRDTMRDPRYAPILLEIEDSCAVRTGHEPGSRGYLEFLRGFMKDVTGAR